MPTKNSCNVECSVLIPARTLEDFPTDLNDCDARSTLAAWTVLWHPELLVKTEQIPAWQRADSPPEPQIDAPEPQIASSEIPSDRDPDPSDSDPNVSLGSFIGHLFIAPMPSIELLPEDYAAKAKSAGAIWITGPDRAAMLEQLKQLGLVQTEWQPQTAGVRTIAVEDFFAAGFAALQIQIMTRRLRYTSNLDQIHLQTRLVNAAKAFIEKRTEDAIQSLHDVFDCLAEERDHYFSNDPHLIDLVLVAPSTLDRAMADPLICHAANHDAANHDVTNPDPKNCDAKNCDPKNYDATNQDQGVLSTPVNVLIDADAIDAIALRNDSASKVFCEQLRENRVGWAAGGPHGSVDFNLLDYSTSARAIAKAHRQATQCIGAPPRVYGRISGDTPSDMISTIASEGYAGVIPINFSAGTGHAPEAKVILPVSCGEDQDGEIEALTAKPIDASSDAAFLSIGAELGESIDSGEIATGLLVHWPGQGCDSYHDLRRLASWSLSLGRFWKVDEYFTEGERPYHQGNLAAIGSDPPTELSELFGNESENPITSAAERFVESSVDRQTRLIGAIGQLLSESRTQSTSLDQTNQSKAIIDLNRIAASIGMTPDSDGDAKLVINANSVPVRVATEIRNPPAAMQHVYSCDRDRDRYVAFVDVPAMGYSAARPSAAGEKSAAVSAADSGVGSWVRNQFLGRSSTIVNGFRLHNEFMEVEISQKSGGVAGVYSGGERGNRFSMRLVAEGFAKSESLMRCDDVLVTKNTAGEGRIEAKGKLLVEGVEIANFVNRYSLVSGSRVLNVRVQLNRSSSCRDDQWSGVPWKNYVAARVAVQDESSICRPMVRDKVHRSQGRRMLAPLGLVIDEAQRQTLITSDGYPLHKAVGKSFYDTLLMVRGQGSAQFNLRYGFDVPQPVAEAWSGLAPAKELPVSANPYAVASSWFIHVGPREVLIGDMAVHHLADEKLGIELELIATRGKASTAKLQFYRDPSSAYRVSSKAARTKDEGILDRKMQDHKTQDRKTQDRKTQDRTIAGD